MAADCPFAHPLTTQTKCLTAVVIPGNPLRSFDISFVNPDRDEYYFADRSNASVDVIDTETLKFKRFLGGFVGVKINTTTGAVDNNHSGLDGVATLAGGSMRATAIARSRSSTSKRRLRSP